LLPRERARRRLSFLLFLAPIVSFPYRVVQRAAATMDRDRASILKGDASALFTTLCFFFFFFLLPFLSHFFFALRGE
jgi:hypothetical protein